VACPAKPISCCGGLKVYNINNNQLTGAAFIGTVGLDWQVVGFCPLNAAGTSDMVLRNSGTGAFEVYDIANNQLTGAAPLGSVGSSDRIYGQPGWFNLSARASDGWLWRRQRRSRRCQCRRTRCRHVTAAVADDTAACLRLACGVRRDAKCGDPLVSTAGRASV